MAYDKEIVRSFREEAADAEEKSLRILWKEYT